MESYGINVRMEARHTQELRWIFDFFATRFWDKFENKVQEEGASVGFNPPLTVDEAREKVKKFFAEVASKLPVADGVTDPGQEFKFGFRSGVRTASVLRYVFEFIGTTTVPAIITLIEDQEVLCPYPVEEIVSVWHIFWKLTNKELPRPDGTFALKDLTEAWRLGLY